MLIISEDDIRECGFLWIDVIWYTRKTSSKTCLFASAFFRAPKQSDNLATIEIVVTINDVC